MRDLREVIEGLKKFPSPLLLCGICGDDEPDWYILGSLGNPEGDKITVRCHPCHLWVMAPLPLGKGDYPLLRSG